MVIGENDNDRNTALKYHIGNTSSRDLFPGNGILMYIISGAETSVSLPEKDLGDKWKIPLDAPWNIQKKMTFLLLPFQAT